MPAFWVSRKLWMPFIPLLKWTLLGKESTDPITPFKLNWRNVYTCSTSFWILKFYFTLSHSCYSDWTSLSDLTHSSCPSSPGTSHWSVCIQSKCVSELSDCYSCHLHLEFQTLLTVLTRLGRFKWQSTCLMSTCLIQVYFGTQHSRVYLMANLLGQNCANGMSWLLKKNYLEEVGGLSAFSEYLAEDFFIGKALWSK